MPQESVVTGHAQAQHVSSVYVCMIECCCVNDHSVMLQLNEDTSINLVSQNCVVLSTPEIMTLHY